MAASKCVKNNDVISLKKILDKGIKMNLNDFLVKTISRDCVEMLDYLHTECKVNLAFEDSILQEYTPLHIAADKNSFRVMEYLLKKGLNPNSLDGDGLPPIFKAIESDSIAAAKVLIENKCSMKAKNDYGFPPLLDAIEHKQFSIAKLLLNNGADKYKEYRPEGDTALTVTVEYGDAEFLKYLLKDYKVRKSDLICVYFAIHDEKIELLRTLLEHKFNPNHKDSVYFYPLYYAHHEREIQCFNLLLDYGADPNFGDNLGFSTFQCICEDEDMNLIEKMYKKGADINHINNDKESCLMTALICNRDNVAKFLIEKGCKLDLKDKEGDNALQFAIEKGKQN
ncbi:hypothetical protein TVAG_250360 [Trichomonas vaginalis G3]|uniref:Uncharacterized protein n=1 Tax=Trichomonas vaginalis (strain ATCC PRA-98 / G3) TaxID=412133 RepID=A2DCN9_TRIV3|nr:spectrin binding [Trichomonas vaginalis G3]EAY21976.1 hypothetical protein TVAG_250360 [Trichomonas vaginalis G3]KAI5487535.1 spectrin binding [Trichomonas vaginalis G3]|eukprot:XP_001582962.1 hypothetical protein [Trichomonas vaginalis G3]